jgi:FkbM family methyltransferase
VFRKLQKLAAMLPVPLYRRGLRLGARPPLDHEPLFRPMRLRTFVDVGANRGYFSLLARHLFPGATIHAFEPLPAPADVYQAIFGGDANCTLHRCALGEAAGSVEMHVAGADHSSSLLPIGALQTQWAPQTAELRLERVKVARLDDVIRGVEADALLKIDVQGYELSVLKGAGSLLSGFRYVYAELSFEELYTGQPLAHEVIAYLAKHGFTLRRVHHVDYHRGVAIQADMLFERTSSLGSRRPLDE